jgi:hypothetical protein
VKPLETAVFRRVRDVDLGHIIFEEDSMKTSRIIGSIALLLISLIVFLGCPTGSSTDPAPPPTTTPKEKASALATFWGVKEGYVEYDGNVTITLKEDITVVNTLPKAQSASYARDVIQVEGIRYVVPSLISQGVTVKVPNAKTLTVAPAVTLETKGTITVAGPTSAGVGDEGKLVIQGTATVALTAAAAKLEVGGILDGTGTIKAEVTGATVKLLQGATVADEGNLTVISPKNTIVLTKGAISTTTEVVNGEGETKPPDVISYDTLSRPTDTAVTYTIQGYDDSSKLVTLTTTGAPVTYRVTDTYFQGLFKAIYTPNAPTSTLDDTTYDGLAGIAKTAVSYTPALSEAVLKLFKITIGTAKTGDKVEITGTDLPDATAFGATPTNLIVIDIGVPGETNALPTFYIPKGATSGATAGGLGASGQDTYGYIRLRVNNGASLVIEADNAGYISGGKDNPCPTGRFNSGCIEVMAGGKLRDGAFEGFPLGSNAVILNRYGSYLSVGPEPTNSDATGSKSEAYNAYYAGTLLGPQGAGKITWNASTSPSDYLEVRPDQIATNAKLTVEASYTYGTGELVNGGSGSSPNLVGLIYSVWFVGDAALTVNGVLASNDGSDVTADKATYKFYGQKSSPTTITIGSNGYLDHRFVNLADAAEKNGGYAGLITNKTLIIDVARSSDAVSYTGTSIFGSPDWKVNAN